VFAGSLAVPVKDSAEEEDLVVRAFVKVGAGGSEGAVVVDIPLDEPMLHKLHDATGVRLENVFDSRVNGSSATRARTSSAQSERSILFERSLAQVDVYDWAAGVMRRDTVAIHYRVRELYNHSRARSRSW
jgi:hypothetical protein